MGIVEAAEEPTQRLAPAVLGIQRILVALDAMLAAQFVKPLLGGFDGYPNHLADARGARPVKVYRLHGFFDIGVCVEESPESPGVPPFLSVLGIREVLRACVFLDPHARYTGTEAIVATIRMIGETAVKQRSQIRRVNVGLHLDLLGADATDIELHRPLTIPEPLELLRRDKVRAHVGPR